MKFVLKIFENEYGISSYKYCHVFVTNLNLILRISFKKYFYKLRHGLTPSMNKKVIIRQSW